MHNYRSIGLLGCWILGGKFCFGRSNAKIWFVAKRVIALCIPQVLTKLLLLFFFFCFLTILCIVQTLSSSKNLSFSFLFYFLLLFFILWLIDFIFLSSIFDFLFFWRTSMTQGKGNFHPRSRFWPKSECLAQKAGKWRDTMYVGVIV